VGDLTSNILTFWWARTFLALTKEAAVHRIADHTRHTAMVAIPCTSSIVGCSLIYLWHLSHTLSLLINWGKTLFFHGKMFPEFFVYCRVPLLWQNANIQKMSVLFFLMKFSNWVYWSEVCIREINLSLLKKTAGIRVIESQARFFHKSWSSTDLLNKDFHVHASSDILDLSVWELQPLITRQSQLEIWSTLGYEMTHEVYHF
jgi:hypothetical protein